MIMRLAPLFPVPTVDVVPMLQKALQDLSLLGKLKNTWLTHVVQTNPGSMETPEYGVILYPSHHMEGNEHVPFLDYRIVLNPLPCAKGILTRVVEINFGQGASRTPFSNTQDHPKDGVFSPCSKYSKDFRAIAKVMEELLNDLPYIRASLGSQAGHIRAKS